MKSKINSAVLITLLMSFSTTSFAAGKLSDWYGSYALKNQISGSCENEVIIKKENFLNSKGAAIGIYNSGIVMQIFSINKGPQKSAQENPMFGGITGYELSQSILIENSLKSTFAITNLAGDVMSKDVFDGSLTNNVLSYKKLEMNKIVQPATSSYSECEYSKK